MNENINCFSSCDGYTTLQIIDTPCGLEASSEIYHLNSMTDEFQHNSQQQQQGASTFSQIQSSNGFGQSCVTHPPSLVNASDFNSPSSKLVDLNHYENDHIPFVRIHTTNAQPTKSCFGNVFRKNQSSNHDEIKSEPIKSENNEGNSSKEASLATPPKIVEGTAPVVFPTNIFKCHQCFFITLSAECLKKHNSVAHMYSERTSNVKDTRSKLLCPGCDNIFYAHSSLNAHLLTDHLMVKEEAAVLMQSTLIQTKENQNAQNLRPQPQKKSRIYLKNVECLREPRQDSNFSHTGTDDSEVVESRENCPDLENTQLSGLPKQKISIKSVDVLREPGLMQRTQQQMLTSDFLTLNSCSENLLIQSLADDQSSRFASIFEDIRQPCTYIDDKEDEEGHIFEKPRRPKIYIKNVDILKEPIFLPPNNLSNILSPGDDLNFNLFHAAAPFTDILLTADVVSSATPTSSSSVMQFDQSEGNLASEHTFRTDTVAVSSSENYCIDDRNRNSPVTFLSSNTEASIALSEITNQQAQLTIHEQQKSKIYIKNADILKQPQFQDSPRRATNLLHLRTVDELNLMNKNEVENLITPNLDGPSTFDSPDENNTKTVYGVFNQSRESTANLSQVSTSVKNITDIYSNSWTADYTLDELDCIIDTSSGSLPNDQKNESQFSHNNLNTPHMVSPSNTIDKETTSNAALEIVEDTDDPEILFVCAEELINATNHSGESSQNLDNIAREPCETERNNAILDLKEHQIQTINDEVEPLIDVTFSSNTELSDQSDTAQQSSQYRLINRRASEKGRIYVSVNLMQASEPTESNYKENSESKFLATSEQRNNQAIKVLTNRGRPLGSRHTSITKIRKLNGSVSDIDVGIKCNLNGCGYRFQKYETLDYHKKCHNSSESNLSIICPECKSTDFSGWNTLHTHIWRSHKIDMELYSCDQCDFKTPVYSRLVNTHSRIHSEERNFKCDQCAKAFKNTKQLKNHRRWHRTSAGNQPTEVHTCAKCGSVFSHLKTLREHVCKHSHLLRCLICFRLLSSKSSFKLHMLTHETACKFKCSVCAYVTNDHNAFRRHKMKHENCKTYCCPFCDYKSIQSSSYQKHIRSKHPENANEIVHKCPNCSFSTINPAVLNIHIAKHKAHTDLKKTNLSQSSKDSLSSNYLSKSDNILLTCLQQTTDSNTDINKISPIKNKIKVKSDLVLTDPAKFIQKPITQSIFKCVDDDKIT